MKLRKIVTTIIIIEIFVICCFCNRSNAIGIENEEQKQSNISDNCLCLLSIDNAVFNPSFNSNICNYETEVYHDFDNVNVIAIPEDESKKIEIVGDKGLKDGNNLVKVNVLSSNGEIEKAYEINVYRRNSEEEAKYQKEQEEAQKKLMTSKEKEEENQNKETKNNNYVFLIAIPGILAIVIVLLIIVFYYMRKF